MSFGFTHGLAPLVDADRHTVRSSESGCGDVQPLSLVPEDGMQCVVGKGRRAAYQAVNGNEERLASRAYGAKVGDCIARRWLCYCERGEQAARGNGNQDRFHVFVTPPFK